MMHHSEVPADWNAGRWPWVWRVSARTELLPWPWSACLRRVALMGCASTGTLCEPVLYGVTSDRHGPGLSQVGCVCAVGRMTTRGVAEPAPLWGADNPCTAVDMPCARIGFDTVYRTKSYTAYLYDELQLPLLDDARCMLDNFCALQVGQTVDSRPPQHDTAAVCAPLHAERHNYTKTQGLFFAQPTRVRYPQSPGEGTSQDVCDKPVVGAPLKGEQTRLMLCCDNSQGQGRNAECAVSLRVRRLRTCSTPGDRPRRRRTGPWRG